MVSHVQCARAYFEFQSASVVRAFYPYCTTSTKHTTISRTVCRPTNYSILILYYEFGLKTTELQTQTTIVYVTIFKLHNYDGLSCKWTVDIDNARSLSRTERYVIYIFSETKIFVIEK